MPPPGVTFAEIRAYLRWASGAQPMLLINRRIILWARRAAQVNQRQGEERHLPEHSSVPLCRITLPARALTIGVGVGAATRERDAVVEFGGSGIIRAAQPLWRLGAADLAPPAIALEQGNWVYRLVGDTRGSGSLPVFLHSVLFPAASTIAIAPGTPS